MKVVRYVERPFFYWISDVLNSHLLNKCFVFLRKSFVCLNSFFIYLFIIKTQAR